MEHLDRRDMSAGQINDLNIVILIISILSVSGAGWIIFSFIMFESLRTFRHQLILGLATSDFIMAMNYLLATARNLSGHNIGTPEEKKFCSFNGFMVEAFVNQTDYWIFIIAICTYLLLTDNKTQSAWIQDHRVILWALPWFFSLLCGGLGLGLIGYWYNGAYCLFLSDKIRLLINYVPRWIIILTIIFLYVRLYLVVHRIRKETSSLASGLSTNPENSLRTQDKVPGVEDIEVGRRESRKSSGSSQRRLKRVSFQMMTYPLVYMFIFIIPTSIRIYQFSTGKTAPFVVGIFDKGMIVTQGFADSIIYGVQENTWIVWRSFLLEKRNR
ncbi:G protein-coupled glucose receptor regulating Gpa2 domain containing protein [Hyaloscypha variabilis]